MMNQLKIFCIASAFGFVLTGCGSTPVDQKETPSVPEATTEATAEVTPPVAEKIDYKTALPGDWVRTDAEYILQVMQLRDDGTVDVKYLNPKPINVGKASWREENGVLLVYVELQDVNYPGSNYTLVYNPETKILAGQYFQAVEKQTFQVEFRKIN